MNGVTKRLLGYSGPLKWTFIGEELQNGSFYPKMVSGGFFVVVHCTLNKVVIVLSAASMHLYTCVQGKTKGLLRQELN